MISRNISLLSAFLLSTSAHTALAQGLPSGFFISDSTPVAVSPLPSVNGRRFDERLQLGNLTPDGQNFLGGSSYTPGRVISDDGSVILGFHTLPPAPRTKFYGRTTGQVVTWDNNGVATAVDLSSLKGGFGMTGVSLSGNGDVIVGNYVAGPVDAMKAGDPFLASRTGFFKRAGKDAVQIGFMNDSPLSQYVEVGGVSHDGNVVFGRGSVDVPAAAPDDSISIDTYEHAFRWTENGGTQSLGSLEAGNRGNSSANAISSDGSVIVGNSSVGGFGSTHAFVWRDGVMTDLGSLYDTARTAIAGLPIITGYSNARDVSADGKVIVGESDQTAVSVGPTGFGYSARRVTAAVWDEKGMSEIGSFSNREHSYSVAEQVSRDGSVAVGYSDTMTLDPFHGPGSGIYTQHAFRWDRTTGMESLGTLQADNQGFSFVNDLSADGQVIVGTSSTDGVIEKTTLAVGSPSTATAAPATLRQRIHRGFVWTRDTGLQDVGTLRDVDGLGSSRAFAISGDGTVVVGQSDTNDTDYTVDSEDAASELFILRLITDPEPAAGGGMKPATTTVGPMLSLPNTQQQLVQSSQQQAGDLGTLSSNLAGVGDGELSVEGVGAGGGETRVSTQGKLPRRLPFAVSFAGSRTKASSGITQNTASLRAATRVGNLTFGGFVQAGKQTQGTATFDYTGSTPSVGVYLRGGEKFGQGFTWKLSYGRINGKAQVTRDAGFANTEIGVGNTTVSASAFSAEAGFGQQLGKASVNSFVRLARSSASRAAFTETAGATFPISYDSLTVDHTTFSIGTAAKFNITNRSSLTIGASVEKDLNSSNNPITGTSAIPGFTSFSVAGPTTVNDTRGAVSASYEYGLRNGSSISVNAYAAQARYSNTLASGMSVAYTARW